MAAEGQRGPYGVPSEEAPKRMRRGSLSCSVCMELEQFIIEIMSEGHTLCIVA